MPFRVFGLSDPLVQGILATGYTAPTEIQSRAIPAAVSGKDIIGCAQTGTGKTAAFVLPILNRLSHESPPTWSLLRRGRSKDSKRVIKSLILTPTRELAAQIEQAIQNTAGSVPLARWPSTAASVSRASLPPCVAASTSSSPPPAD